MQQFLNSFLPGWETGALWSDIRKKDKSLIHHNKLEKRWWTWESRPEVKPTHLFYQTASKTTVLQLETMCLDWLNELASSNVYFGEGNGTPLQYSCLESPMDGGAWWTAVHGVAGSRTRLSDFTFTFHFSLLCIGEGNGNPLQCSCLENPGDGGAWWAAVYGVAQSRTRLKRLSSSVYLL